MAIESIVKDALIIIGAPVLRSVAGWAGNALQDNVVSKFEWKQLAETIVRVGTLGVVGYFGFQVAGVDNAAMAGAVAAFVADKLFRTINPPVKSTTKK